MRALVGGPGSQFMRDDLDPLLRVLKARRVKARRAMVRALRSKRTSHAAVGLGLVSRRARGDARGGASRRRAADRRRRRRADPQGVPADAEDGRRDRRLEPGRRVPRAPQEGQGAPLSARAVRGRALPRGRRQADDQVAQVPPGRARPPPGPRGADRAAAVARTGGGGGLGRGRRADGGRGAGGPARRGRARGPRGIRRPVRRVRLRGSAPTGQGDVRDEHLGFRPSTDDDLRSRSVAGPSRAAPLQRRARHERDAQVDPGAVSGRGRGADREPGPARRGLRRHSRQGVAAGGARLPRGRRARGVRARVHRPRDQGQRHLRPRLSRCSPRSDAR